MDAFFGQAAVGWMRLKQALATRRRGDSPPNGDFRAGKVAAFRYFMRYELAKVLLRPVESLDACAAKFRRRVMAAGAHERRSAGTDG